MIIGKSKREIEKMRAAGQLVGQVLAHFEDLVKPGITTIEIDRIAEKMIRDAGALPTFKGYNGFPYSICASVNEQDSSRVSFRLQAEGGRHFLDRLWRNARRIRWRHGDDGPCRSRSMTKRLKLIRVTEECLGTGDSAVPAGKSPGRYWLGGPAARGGAMAIQ